MLVVCEGVLSVALMQITVLPLGTETTSIGDFIAEVLRTVEETGAEHKLTDMGTIIYGDADQLFAIANQAHQSPFAKGAKRVVTTLEIDDRRDKQVKIGDKITSVKSRLTD